MRHKQWIAVAAGIACTAAAVAVQRTDAGFRPLSKTHRWFELRAAATEQTPAVVRGALAAAFNDPDSAERLLREVIRADRASEDADDAYAMLARVYLRSGQYERFVGVYEAWTAAIPGSAAAREERENLDKYRGRPNQINGPRRPSTLHFDPGAYVMLPVTVDGKTDTFIFDTGALQSVVTEREAKKLGLTIRDDVRTLIDLSGTRTAFRTAVAQEVSLGAMTFRDVSFAVITPGGALADTEIGIIGLPIIIAMGGLTWSPDGTAEFGRPSGSDRAAEPNLVFDRHRLALRADVLGKSVLATLDTGANTTDLNANFADAFPDAIARGKKGSADLNGIGGTRTFESIELSEVIFGIAGRQVPLRPATVTMQRNAITGGECCVANAGQDLLMHGRGVTIDLTRMTLLFR